jgi:hypothetical protein
MKGILAYKSSLELNIQFYGSNEISEKVSAGQSVRYMLIIPATLNIDE